MKDDLNSGIRDQHRSMWIAAGLTVALIAVLVVLAFNGLYLPEIKAH